MEPARNNCPDCALFFAKATELRGAFGHLCAVIQGDGWHRQYSLGLDNIKAIEADAIEQFWRVRVAKEEAETKLRDALDILELLVDHQNGCPLPKYEKEWGEAMRRANVALGRATP